MTNPNDIPTTVSINDYAVVCMENEKMKEMLKEVLVLFNSGNFMLDNNNFHSFSIEGKNINILSLSEKIENL